MYEFFFWFIFGVSIGFAIIDVVRARDDGEWKENTNWHFNEILTLIAITVATTLLALFANQHGLSNDETIMLITLTMLLMPVRKIVDVVIYGINSYLVSVDNSYAAKMDQRLLITNQKTGKKEFSVGILRLYHTAVFLFFLVLYMFCSAFPGIAMSRLNVTLNVWSNIPAKATGSSLDRFVLMIWLLSLIVLIVMVLVFARAAYKNFIAWWSDIEDRRDIRKLLYGIIILMIVRKIFLYIFIMTNYRLQDFAFWWVIFVMITTISFALWYRARRNG